MKRPEPKRPIKCVVTVNVSHSVDATLRESQRSRIAMAGSSRDLGFPATHIIACSICSVIL
jgi:hypothetical protein